MFHNSPLQSTISIKEPNDDYSVELTKQQIYGSLRRSRKRGKNIGINTSRMLLFNNSSQLIQPITHIHFSQPQPQKNDGLDQQLFIPNKSSQSSPIHKSQQTQKRTQSTFHSNNPHPHTYTSKLGSLNAKYGQSIRGMNYNPQKLQSVKSNIKQFEKINKIVYENLKNVEMGEDLVKQSRKKSSKFVNLFEAEDKPVTKKNFKISAPFRLSQSKLAAKQEILADARKMADQNTQKPKQKSESRFFGVEKQKSRSKSKSKSRSKSKDPLTNSQNKYNKQNSSRQSPPSDPSAESLYIHLLSPISFLKQTLIESSKHLTVSFSMPTSLFTPPKPTTSISLIKQMITQIFSEAGMETHIVSIKKYTDRVEIKNKNMCIIWYYDGRGYFGEWKGGDQILANLNRHGVGLAWNSQGNSGDIYYGEFRDDKREGYGILKQQNQQIYVGEWKDGRKSGWGKFYGTDHQLKCKGQFTDDIFVGCP